MKYDLGFGNSVAVRQAFVASYHGNPMYFAKEELLKMDYPDHSGDPDLVELTRAIIKRQTGRDYRHVLLTNGATGGVVISLRAYQQMGFEYCHTRNAPYYVRYPRMITASNLMHVQEDHAIYPKHSVMLLDIPSNPLGQLTPWFNSVIKSPVILDGVYLNNVYMPWRLPQIPANDVLIGSYSKLLGINGIRVGWIATNDDLLYVRLKELVAGEYCGLSSASTEILMHTLQGLSWDNFEASARMKLDNNREEWTKMERFFGNQPIPSNGMFYYGPTDAKCRELLAKAGITYTPGGSLGTTDDFGRFNLGQDNELTERAVQAMLKADKL